VQRVPRAVILINTNVGTEDEVLNQLKQIPEVKEAYITYGIYDIVAIIEAEKFDELRSVVVNKIRKLSNVKSTTTLIVVEK